MTIAKELVHEMAEYLSRRFPQMYTVTRKSPVKGDFGWYGEGEIATIRIQTPSKVDGSTGLDVTYDLDKDDPMAVAGLL